MSDFAKEYADKIVLAVRNDQIVRAAGRTQKSLGLATSSHLARALQEIGPEFEGLIYQQTRLPISEDDKQKIANEIAEHLGWNQPRKLRQLIKGGSVDTLLTMSQEMEALFLAVRK